MFPKTLKELQDLIIRIWKPSIDSLRRTKQDNIQFQDEGVDQGTSGGITTVNFTGPGVTASDSGSTLTVNITGGSGDVTKVGTPVNNQVGVWTGDGTIQGDSALTFNTSTDKLTVDGRVHTRVIESHTNVGLLIEANGGADVALFGAGGGQSATFYDGVKLDASTASRILSTDASKNITALDTTTYPSLTELSYIKGLSSAVQTQINNKPDDFLELTDTPSTYAGQGLKLVRVNATPNALEFVTANSSLVGLGNVANVDTTTTANITDSSGKRFVSDANVNVRRLIRR